MRRLAALLASVAALALPACAADLVVARAGTLPILLTAPHGGSVLLPNVATRRNGTTSTDAHTIELAEALARHLEARLGGRPYVVIARFSRKHVDANRVEAEAYEDPAAKAAYDRYHASIREYVHEMRAAFPNGALLLDIHGQSDDPSVVHRGTRNGATVAALLRRHGDDALVGPRSVLGVVAQRGFTVFPPNGAVATSTEDRRFNGGHTVHAYGSSQAAGIDALQVEVGRALRTDAAFAAALADGLAAFHESYLRAR